MEDDGRLPATCVSNGHPAWREAIKNRWQTGETASMKACRTTWSPDSLTARCIYTTHEEFGIIVHGSADTFHKNLGKNIVSYVGHGSHICDAQFMVVRSM